MFSCLSEYPEPPDRDAHIWTANIESLSSAEVRDLASLLDPTERVRAAQFHFERDQKNYVVTRGLLRRLLAITLHRPASALAFMYAARGKPALIAENTQDRTLYFNVTHSSGFAMFALVWNRQVGIDLESTARLDRDEKKLCGLATRVLSPNELVIWHSLPDVASRRAALLRAWTRKEALAKATGEGLFIEPRSLELVLDAGAPEHSLTIALAEHGPYTICDLHAPRDFAAALAIEQDSLIDRL